MITKSRTRYYELSKPDILQGENVMIFFFFKDRSIFGSFGWASGHRVVTQTLLEFTLLKITL